MAATYEKKKNFTYGDIWVTKEMRVTQGRELIDPAKLTKNQAFLDYLKAHHYRVYLDRGHRGLAQTMPQARTIIINGNYSPELTEIMLQHEMGHLMLFDVNQFITVGNQTLRSVIAKIIYTPENLIKYGIEQLLFTENVVQDVIIETTSNGNCVCHGFLRETGENAGVKHLDTLESAVHIAREVCKNVLVPREDYGRDFPLDSLEELIDAMLKGLRADQGEIAKEIEETRHSDDFEARLTRRRSSEAWKKQRQLEKIKDKIRRGKGSDRLDAMRDRIEGELRDLLSKETTKKLKEKARAQRQRAVESLEKKLARSGELEKMLEQELAKARERAEEGGQPSVAARYQPQEDGNAHGDSDPHHSEVTDELHSNTTDHLSEDFESTGGHSFDCGLPHPVFVRRDESHKNEANLLRFDCRPRVKKIQIQDDDLDNVLASKNKIPQHELTYFKSAKREWDHSDMLQGKRKLRVSGINVLVGLDISGSMTQEWGSMFRELSEVIGKLKEELDIDNIVYFTYNQKLQQWSKDINDLKIQAGGGNAFGYVYQEMLTELPVLQRNEIILVTDCGDNLGFRLNDVVEAERGGVKVENHISIIDTENAGFYEKNGFEEDDWSLYRYNDRELFKSIRANIERLIER